MVYVTEDTETLVVLLLEYLRLLGFDLAYQRGGVDTARRFLVADQGMEWADAKRMSARQVIAELRVLCVKRGLIADETESAGAADDDFRSGEWFKRNTDVPPSRLRMAAQRQSKRVRKRKIDGVVCYSESDAKRWWPSDMTKPSIGAT